MDEPMMLMSAHGTVVCGNEAGLYHVPLRDLGDANRPLLLGVHASTQAGRFDRLLVGANTELTMADVAGLPAGCELVLAGGRRTASLRRSGLFYSAEPGSALPCDRTTVGTWEQFLFVTAEDVATLNAVLANRWIIGSTKHIVDRTAVQLREGFLLAIGPLLLDLRYTLPFIVHDSGPGGTAGAFSLSVLVGGWKIERIHRYDPMIYLTAFGSPQIMDRAFTAIASLLEFGGYDGIVHVITDKDEETFLGHVPGLSAAQLSLQRLAPRDNLGYLAAKLSILDHVPAYARQPVFFMDSDVVCDAPLEPMLATVVMLGRMSAPLEDTTFLRTNPSVGATLIQRAGLSPRWACGINTGTIGMPHLGLCIEALELARAILTNHADLFGRDAFPWVDQEVINYVSYQAVHFDTEALLRFVRYGWEGDEFDGTRRLGLLHFWPGIEGRPKEDRMRDYVATLRRSRKDSERSAP